MSRTDDRVPSSRPVGVADGTETPAEAAASASLHAFLNCYLREAADAEPVPAADAPVETDAPEVLVCRLSRVGAELLVGRYYRSPTGRHLFETPAHLRLDGPPIPADLASVAALVARDLALAANGDASADDLLARVLASRRNIERFVAAHDGDGPALDSTFREAEQSLPFGHLVHPTPKSREGIAAHERRRYAPELGGSFPLRYVRADRGVVSAWSATSAPDAVEWVKEHLRADPTVGDAFVERHVESDDALVPVHPWQAESLAERDCVTAADDDGSLSDLGPVGREFYPTSSVRTLYAPGAEFMVKCSLGVRITNSERTNKRPELRRGVAVADLLDAGLGDDLRATFPRFDVIRDPAALTLDVGPDAESGFEVVLRENPFGPNVDAAPVVALCQDGAAGPSRLVRLVRDIADREGRPEREVAREWFDRYLATFLRPVLWLYLARGVGVEAHQQNTVVELEAGWPVRAYYRDNQGYYFPESVADEVDARCPGVVERADTRCADAVADERLRYYVVINNAFGVVNALGVGDVADERELLAALRDELREAEQSWGRPASSLVEELLTERRVPCKANLLTRLRGLDELVGPLSEQSVYVDIPNPLVAEPGVAR